MLPSLPPPLFFLYDSCPQEAISTGTLVLPLSLPTCSIAIATSMPFTTLPKATCLPSSQPHLAVQRKNWEELVLGPVLDMETTPGPSCLRVKFWKDRKKQQKGGEKHGEQVSKREKVESGLKSATTQSEQARDISTSIFLHLSSSPYLVRKSVPINAPPPRPIPTQNVPPMANEPRHNSMKPAPLIPQNLPLPVRGRALAELEKVLGGAGSGVGAEEDLDAAGGAPGDRYVEVDGGIGRGHWVKEGGGRRRKVGRGVERRGGSGCESLPKNRGRATPGVRERSSGPRERSFFLLCFTLQS